MSRLRLLCLLSASFLLAITAAAQGYPDKDGQRARYNAMIEMPKTYVSGVCIMLREGETVKGSLFNEFGISALDFIYNEQKDKVKLQNVMGMMNKWYIKKVLKKDLRALLKNLKSGVPTYTDEKYKINFTFTPLEDETTE